MPRMPVPEQIRTALSRWCADRVPDGERDRRQVAYTTHEDTITIVERRPPTYPELDSAWSSTPVAQLRGDDPEPGRWTLYRPAAPQEAPSEWLRTDPPAHDPLELLGRLG